MNIGIGLKITRGADSGAVEELSYSITVSAGATYTVGIAAVAGKTVTVNWGDGASTDVTYSAGDYQNQNHVYAAAGTYVVRISDMWDLKGFQHALSSGVGSPVMQISRLISATGLTYYRSYGSGYGVGDVDFIPRSLTNFYPPVSASNRITGSFSGLPSGLTYINLNNTSVSGRLTISAATTLISNHRAPIIIPADFAFKAIMAECTISPASGFGLRTDDVDAVIIKADTSVTWGAAKQLRLIGACEYRSSASDAAATSLAAKGVTLTVTGRHADGLYSSDVHGNRVITTPSEIICFGDSLTQATYPAALSALLSGRSVTNAGVGGEKSNEIAARCKGHDVVSVPIAPGVVRLKTKQVVPYRMTWEASRSLWTEVGQRIAEPRQVRFYNATGTIATTKDQLYAVCASDGSGYLQSKAHPFVDGDEIYFRTLTVTGMYLKKVYYVRDVTADSFRVSEYSGADAVALGEGMLCAWGGFYYDWTYTNQDTSVGVDTYTGFDDKLFVIWAGANDSGSRSAAQVLASIAEMVGRLKATNKRYIVMSPIGSASSVIGSGGYTFIETVLSGIVATYPDNHIDIWHYLRNQYNPELPQDVIDYNNGIIASSLRIDSIHMTTTGYQLVAQQVANFITAKGW